MKLFYYRRNKFEDKITVPKTDEPQEELRKWLYQNGHKSVKGAHIVLKDHNMKRLKLSAANWKEKEIISKETITRLSGPRNIVRDAMSKWSFKNLAHCESFLSNFTEVKEYESQYTRNGSTPA